MTGWESLSRFKNQFREKLEKLYSKEKLQALAKETGFLQRKSKLRPWHFLDMVLFKQKDNREVSLNDHSTDLDMTHQVNIRKQSIQERFNEYAVDFIRRLLNQQIGNQISSEIHVACLKHFSSVKIKDSTRFQLPAHLKDHYPGSSGAASGAGIHTQFEYDLLSGMVSDINPTDALRQDQTDAAQTLSQVEKGSLLIRDLGYYSHEVLENIHERGAYFISRLKPAINVYESTTEDIFQELSLPAIHAAMKKAKLAYREMPVYIGSNKLAVRLIIERLPEQVVSKRIAKATREAKKKGRQLSEKYKTYAALNLFITNVPLQWIPTHQVRTLYRLRWQIELRFKAWKSYCDLDKIKKMNRYRFECYLYATLLFILINWEIAVNFMGIIWKSRFKMMSILKFYKTVSQHKERLRRIMIKDFEAVGEYLADLFKISQKNLMLERKKFRLSSEEILLLNLDNQEDKW